MIESSPAGELPLRNDDPFTEALRLPSDKPFDLAMLVGLHRQAPSSIVDTASVGTRTMSVWSSHKPSSHTKPTSDGTTYPFHYKQDEGSGVPMYSSSLSATDGSVSDNEPQLARDRGLLEIGTWVPVTTELSPPLKGGGRPQRRGKAGAPKLKWKKPPVVIHQQATGRADKSMPSEPRPVHHCVCRTNCKGMLV